MSKLSLFFDVDEDISSQTSPSPEIIPKVNVNKLNKRLTLTSFFDDGSQEMNDIWDVGEKLDSETVISILNQVLPVLCEIIPINILCNLCVCTKLREFPHKVFFTTTIGTFYVPNYSINRQIFEIGICRYIQNILHTSIITDEQNNDAISKINNLLILNPNIHKMYAELEYDTHNPQSMEVINKNLRYELATGLEIDKIYGEIQSFLDKIINSIFKIDIKINIYLHQLTLRSRQDMMCKLMDSMFIFFKEKIGKITNLKMYYDTISFYGVVFSVITNICIYNLCDIALEAFFIKYNDFIFTNYKVFNMITNLFKKFYSAENFESFIYESLKYRIKNFILFFKYKFHVKKDNSSFTPISETCFVNLTLSLLKDSTGIKIMFLYYILINDVISEETLRNIKKGAINWKNIISKLGEGNPYHSFTIEIIRYLFNKNICLNHIIPERKDLYFECRNEILDRLVIDNYTYFTYKYMKALFR